MPALVFDDCLFHRMRLQGECVIRIRAAAEIVEQAAFALAELGGRNLAGNACSGCKPGLREAARKRSPQPLKIVERNVIAAPGRQRHDNLRVNQSGCAGHPGTFPITGKPDLERKLSPRKPPCDRLRNRSPMLPDGLGAVAGIPPQVAQSPMATTWWATRERSASQDFIGLPAKRSHFAGAVGRLMIVPLEHQDAEWPFAGDERPQK